MTKTPQYNVPELRFPEFEGEWNILKLNEVLLDKTEGIKRGPFGGALKKEIFVNEGYAIYEQRNAIYDNQEFRYYINKDKYEEMKSFEVQPGDLIMSCSGTIGKLSKIPKDYKKGIINQALIRFRTKSNILSQYFLFYMRSNIMQRKILEVNPGSAITNLIPVKELKNLCFPLPNLNEQEKIGTFFSKLDRQIELEEKKLELLEQQKKGYMQKIFSQELRFKDENGNEYPEWEEKKLGEIGTTFSGLTGKTKEDFGIGDSKYITYMNVYKNTIVDEDLIEKVNVNETEKQNLVKKGDIFFTASSETPNEVGISSVLNYDLEDTYLNSFCFGFRLNTESVLPTFLVRLLESNDMRKEIFPLAQGSTRFNISKKELLKITILIPYKDEQIKINDFLTLYDGKLKKCKRRIEYLKLVKKALLQKMFI